ncbi:MAG TPA: bifunctional serine/threonine-protein kinase/formylglycine-generating enzyme family protein [Halomicronema sp.]
MIHCLNPDCPKPENSDNLKFCVSCGQPLVKKLQNRYIVKKALGRGGFGKTYLAEDEERLNIPCVIKQFTPNPENLDDLEDDKQRFYKEAQQLFKLGEEHLQIPTLFGYFEADKYLYLVQQYIQGKTLLQELVDEGNFNEQKIRALLNDILPILQFVHERNVIHRDIKPENIIRRQSDGKLFLIDFGIAKQYTGTVLSLRQWIGRTPCYQPMEQIFGRTLPCSDLYSLGVTCIRLMTKLFLKIERSDPLYDAIKRYWLWRKKLPQWITVSEQLGEVLDTLLEYLPRYRYQSAKDVLNALNTEAMSTTILLPPPPKTTAASKPSSNIKTFSFDVITVNAQGKEINRQRQQAEYFTEDLGAGIILDMVSIPGGTFSMGSPTSEAQRVDNESPQHWVTVKPFYLGKYAVTQAQWKAVASLAKVKQDLDPDPSNVFCGGNKPAHQLSWDDIANKPINQVSWDDAIEFCARLSKKTGKNYRLPSEAEWEYACRAGTSTPFHFGETITPDLVNYHGKYPYASAPKGKYRDQTTDVGSFPPNAFGLYDMHGNVWEWCQDVFHENYNGAPTDGSAWETGGDSQYRKQRGGSWYDKAGDCRCDRSIGFPPHAGLGLLGFRVAVSPGVSP